MKLCQKYKIHLLADEVYALSVYGVPDPCAVDFKSVLSFDSSPYIDSNLLHHLYGNPLFVPGVHTELMKAMSAITQFHWTAGPSESLAIAMLEDEEWVEGFLEKSCKELARLNKITRDLLEEKGIRYHSGANAGFFLWTDLRPYLKDTGKEGCEAEQVLMQHFLDNKVSIVNGESMSAEEPGWFRIIFSQEEWLLREGLKRVFEVIGV
ncbi:hypothetical protein LTR66_013948 [Elasticomyces elasticus]|nr:hypothetical protein LTR66_013948 [Elasticomyces elasticus]